MRSLLRLEVENFRSLRKVGLDLQPLNVLVGPNAAGKSNLLKVIQFLGDTVRDDLMPALDEAGGYERLHFRGETNQGIRIGVKARVTSYASDKAPDEYSLGFRVLRRDTRVVVRKEEFVFKRKSGPGRRITIKGGRIVIAGTKRQLPLNSTSAGLSTLPRLTDREGGEQVRQLGELFATFRVFDVDAAAARTPADARRAQPLAPNASNLAAFLAMLRSEHHKEFARLEDDARSFLPGLKGLQLRNVGGPTEAVAVDLVEDHLRGVTPLADASFGTIRALALLALLHDPAPPRLTCIEEVDHGLHPHVFDRLVDRLREASARTQLLLVTHSPALVNRLMARELIVCERDPATGESRIPAIASERVAEMEKATGGELGLGELWFSGSLGGGLQ